MTSDDEVIHSDEQIEVKAMVEGFLSGWENVKPNLDKIDEILAVKNEKDYYEKDAYNDHVIKGTEDLILKLDDIFFSHPASWRPVIH